MLRNLMVLIGALGAITSAQLVRDVAKAARPQSDLPETPYAPSPGAAPYVALGYRELAADLFSLRMLGYFAGQGETAQPLADLVDAVIALDPQYKRTYEFGARMITIAERGVDNAAYERAIAVLRKGMAAYPTAWKYPHFAGEIYLQDLATPAEQVEQQADGFAAALRNVWNFREFPASLEGIRMPATPADDAQRKVWDEIGVELIEAAVRMPSAPASAAALAATVRTKLGQKTRAINELREMLLVTDDAGGREKLIRRLAALEEHSQLELATEIADQRTAFDREWKRTRPALTATMYVILGPAPVATFDLDRLALGERHLELPPRPEKLPSAEELDARYGLVATTNPPALP